MSVEDGQGGDAIRFVGQSTRFDVHHDACVQWLQRKHSPHTRAVHSLRDADRSGTNDNRRTTTAAAAAATTDSNSGSRESDQQEHSCYDGLHHAHDAAVVHRTDSAAGLSPAAQLDALRQRLRVQNDIDACNELRWSLFAFPSRPYTPLRTDYNNRNAHRWWPVEAVWGSGTAAAPKGNSPSRSSAAVRLSTDAAAMHPPHQDTRTNVSKGSMFLCSADSIDSHSATRRSPDHTISRHASVRDAKHDEHRRSDAAAVDESGYDAAMTVALVDGTQTDADSAAQDEFACNQHTSDRLMTQLAYAEKLQHGALSGVMRDALQPRLGHVSRRRRSGDGGCMLSFDTDMRLAHHASYAHTNKTSRTCESNSIGQVAHATHDSPPGDVQKDDDSSHAAEGSMRTRRTNRHIRATESDAKSGAAPSLWGSPRVSWQRPLLGGYVSAPQITDHLRFLLFPQPRVRHDTNHDISSNSSSSSRCGDGDDDDAQHNSGSRGRMSDAAGGSGIHEVPYFVQGRIHVQPSRLLSQPRCAYRNSRGSSSSRTMGSMSRQDGDTIDRVQENAGRAIASAEACVPSERAANAATRRETGCTLTSSSPSSSSQPTDSRARECGVVLVPGDVQMSILYARKFAPPPRTRMSIVSAAAAADAVSHDRSSDCPGPHSDTSCDFDEKQRDAGASKWSSLRRALTRAADAVAVRMWFHMPQTERRWVRTPGHADANGSSLSMQANVTNEDRFSRKSHGKSSDSMADSCIRTPSNRMTSSHGCTDICCEGSELEQCRLVGSGCSVAVQRGSPRHTSHIRWSVAEAHGSTRAMASPSLPSHAETMRHSAHHGTDTNKEDNSNSSSSSSGLVKDEHSAPAASSGVVQDTRATRYLHSALTHGNRTHESASVMAPPHRSNALANEPEAAFATNTISTAATAAEPILPANASKPSQSACVGCESGRAAHACSIHRSASTVVAPALPDARTLTSVSVHHSYDSAIQHMYLPSWWLWPFRVSRHSSCSPATDSAATAAAAAASPILHEKERKRCDGWLSMGGVCGARERMLSRYRTQWTAGLGVEHLTPKRHALVYSSNSNSDSSSSVVHTAVSDRSNHVSSTSTSSTDKSRNSSNNDSRDDHVSGSSGCTAARVPSLAQMSLFGRLETESWLELPLWWRWVLRVRHQAGWTLVPSDVVSPGRTETSTRRNHTTAAGAAAATTTAVEPVARPHHPQSVHASAIPPSSSITTASAAAVAQTEHAITAPQAVTAPFVTSPTPPPMRTESANTHPCDSGLRPCMWNRVVNTLVARPRRSQSLRPAEQDSRSAMAQSCASTAAASLLRRMMLPHDYFWATQNPTWEATRVRGFVNDYSGLHHARRWFTLLSLELSRTGHASSPPSAGPASPWPADSSTCTSASGSATSSVAATDATDDMPVPATNRSGASLNISVCNSAGGTETDSRTSDHTCASHTSNDNSRRVVHSASSSNGISAADTHRSQHGGMFGRAYVQGFANVCVADSLRAPPRASIGFSLTSDTPRSTIDTDNTIRTHRFECSFSWLLDTVQKTLRTGETIVEQSRHAAATVNERAAASGLRVSPVETFRHMRCGVTFEM